MDYEEAYRDHVAKAVYQAVVLASKEESGAALIQTGPAFDALMTVAVFVIAAQLDLVSPAAVRRFSEDVAKLLRREIAAIRSDPDYQRVYENALDLGKIN